jgi:acyl carrier protein
MPTDRAKILDQVRELAITTSPELKASDITETATFGTMGLDSVRMVELGVRLEQLFGPKVVLDDWIDQEAARGDKSYTVESLVTFIESALAPK